VRFEDINNEGVRESGIHPDPVPTLGDGLVFEDDGAVLEFILRNWQPEYGDDDDQQTDETENANESA